VILLFIFTLNFRYLKPQDVPSIRVSHRSDCRARIEQLASPDRAQAIVFEKEYRGAGIEEEKVSGLGRGLYLFLVDKDTTVLVVTDINITTIKSNGFVTMLATEDGRPIPDLAISVFGKEMRRLKTNTDGVALLYGSGNYFIFTNHNGNLWLGRVKVPEVEVDKRIEIIPLGKRGDRFYFSAIYLEDFLPRPAVKIKSMLIRNDSLITLPCQKTDRFGSIIDSIKIDDMCDRMILVADDTRAVYSFRGEIPVRQSKPEIVKITTDRLVYRPGDTLVGVFDPELMSNIDILDPQGMRLAPNIKGEFFTIPLMREGRYRLNYDGEWKKIFVGRRGPLTFEEIPILIRLPYVQIRPGDEILIKVYGPMEDGALLYQFYDQAGSVWIKDGQGEIRLTGERIGEQRYVVALQENDRRMGGSVTIEVKSDPQLEIDEGLFEVRSGEPARILVLLFPAVEDTGQVVVMETGLESVKIDPQPEPGRYRMRVLAIGSQGRTAVERFIDVD